MIEEFIIDTDACYHQAWEKANQYFKTLYSELLEATYISALTHDLQSWKQNHIFHSFLFKLFSKKQNQKDFKAYIKWLDQKGELEAYLDRSISYIYLRDLGQSLASKSTQTKVKQTVHRFKNDLSSFNKKEYEFFSLTRLYRKAEEAGIESAFIWLVNKLNEVYRHIPKEMDADEAERKLIKIIGGVVMHVEDAMENDVLPEERAKRLDQAIRLGYSYGLTYPFIDDLLDANLLSQDEKQNYSNIIRSALTKGAVPELGDWTGENINLVQYVHAELKEAFEYIQKQQPPELRKQFYEQAYVFFHAQEVDRLKDLKNPSYSNEELYIPVMLKSASSRLIVRSLINAKEDTGFENRTFFYGIYNQLADDFTDLFADIKAGAVTPYTYYLTHHDKRDDLINPFELYWVVIYNLIHKVYRSDHKTQQLILDRAINGQRRFKQRIGNEKYNEVMRVFAIKSPNCQQLIQKMIRKGDNVDFFDKLLRDHMITSLKKDRRDREAFLATAKTARQEINSNLKIYEDKITLVENPIIDAANYSLGGNGKRLRPIMTWVMGIKEYGFKSSALVPLLRSLEFMHTASLIFDDLPSQDNAATRRGMPTLHQVHNVAIAELTGIFLTQKAVEEQASLYLFNPKTVLQLIRYSAKITEAMCQGQAMDLVSVGKPLTLEQLEKLSFYKTGIAFEAALIMPAILAEVIEAESEALKKFARHAGIAFQIKDDLLDVEGDRETLGKPVGQDAKNHHSTFVTHLGTEGARKAMWEQYCLANEALQAIPLKTSFLKQLTEYIVNRNH